MYRTLSVIVGAALAVAPLSGAAAPRIPAEAVRMEKDSLGLRASQTRRFETTDELKLLQGGAGVLQDLGFNIDTSETKLGLVAASKTRDATDNAQRIGAVVLGAIAGVDMSVDRVQNITASFVTRPSLKGNILVRVMFQRIVYDDRNEVSRVEALDDPEIYAQFFTKLQKAVFLKAHTL
jgi:hypothetical protein